MKTTQIAALITVGSKTIICGIGEGSDMIEAEREVRSKLAYPEMIQQVTFEHIDPERFEKIRRIRWADFVLSVRGIILDARGTV